MIIRTSFLSQFIFNLFFFVSLSHFLLNHISYHSFLSFFFTFTLGITQYRVWNKYYSKLYGEMIVWGHFLLGRGKIALNIINTWYFTNKFFQIHVGHLPPLCYTCIRACVQWRSQKSHLGVAKTKVYNLKKNQIFICIIYTVNLIYN